MYILSESEKQNLRNQLFLYFVKNGLDGEAAQKMANDMVEHMDSSNMLLNLLADNQKKLGKA